jgi:hypothetical protein
MTTLAQTIRIRTNADRRAVCAPEKGFDPRLRPPNRRSRFPATSRPAQCRAGGKREMPPGPVFGGTSGPGNRAPHPVARGAPATSRAQRISAQHRSSGARCLSRRSSGPRVGRRRARRRRNSAWRIARFARRKSCGSRLGAPENMGRPERGSLMPRETGLRIPAGRARPRGACAARRRPLAGDS